MNLQKSFGILSIDGNQIGSYGGFYSLKDLSSVVEGFSVHRILRNDSFLSLFNHIFGTSLGRKDKIVSELKRLGLYIRHDGISYCDIRLFILFYVFSCDEAMLDCLRSGFGI